MNKTSKPPPRRRGFWLLELMTVLVLLAEFALIATRLFAATLQLTRGAGEARNATASIDAGIAALRADVWAAGTISTTNPQAVALKLPGGRTVIWSINGDRLTRLEANKEGHWQAAAAPALPATVRPCRSRLSKQWKTPASTKCG